jgi:transglutaminase-like putative cysteine protease
MSRLYLLVLALQLTLLASAQTSKVQKEKEPSWVTLHNFNYASSILDSDAEEGYIDLDYELQVSLPQQAKYVKSATRILSEAGVQNNSEISVNFDPTYQQLIFHSIKIIRGNQTIDRLQLSKVKVIQQEKELDMHLYNGALTALLLLEDVRKGDIIEYSYTLKGFNPIYNNRYAAMYDTKFSVPVYNLYYKLIVPNNRNLVIKQDRIDVNPVVHQLPTDKIYEWTLTNLPPLHTQDNLPSWYDPYSCIRVSEFTSWKEVNDWAKALFPFNLPLSAALQKKIAEIKDNNTTDEARTLAALRFVQDDIRYMGIEIGTGSHKPNPPNKIMAQRFGDCKDKSYLLCTILRALGIEANPVLINTEYKKTIAQWLPSPAIFDHCTVTAKVNNTVYWFDPTISYQRGRLKDISYPDYQCGLVVSDKTEGLTFIPTQTKGNISVKETFNVPDMSGVANLVVKTVYTGYYADDTRDDFKNNSRYEMLKKYRGYYSSYFNNLSADSIAYTDDENTGTFTTIEYYRLHDFWKTEKETKKASLSPFSIDAALRKPEQENRTMPFQLSYPSRYKEEVEVNLPEDWNAESSSDKIQCPSFILKYDFTTTKRQIRLQYEYETLKDHVSPDEIKDYLSSYQKVDDNVGYSLTYSDGTTASFTMVKDKASFSDSGSTYPLLYTILGICLFITIMIKRSR